MARAQAKPKAKSAAKDKAPVSTKDNRQAVLETFQLAASDTGSTPVQVAILSTRIQELTEHLKSNPKDFSTRRGLVMMVGRRRRLLAYYKASQTPDRYQKLLETLSLRK